MASAWAKSSEAARTTLEEAADVLGFDLPALMAGGPAEELNDTHNQQPALLAASVAILRAARGRGPRDRGLNGHGQEFLPDADVVAGHSLGEFSALVAAGALDYPTALRTVRERGRLMKLAGQRQPGSMAAVLGLADEQVGAICAEIPGVQVANYNAPGQVVISGTAAGVETAGQALRAAGARRIMALPITIAAHSELMRSVADEWSAAVSAAGLRDATLPVVANLSAAPIMAAADLDQELTGQLTGAVRWTDSVHAMIGLGVTTFYEVGPGTVLTGLVKRILADAPVPPELHSLAEPGTD